MDVQFRINILRARFNHIIIFASSQAPTYAVDEVPQDGWGDTRVALIELVKTELVEYGRVVRCQEQGE